MWWLILASGAVMGTVVWQGVRVAADRRKKSTPAKVPNVKLMEDSHGDPVLVSNIHRDCGDYTLVAVGENCHLLTAEDMLLYVPDRLYENKNIGNYNDRLYATWWSKAEVEGQLKPVGTTAELKKKQQAVVEKLNAYREMQDADAT